jgi:broad specificity phosphatase PhoE
MTTRIVLIRHGDTPASQDGRFTGANDIPLSTEGRVHASELATRLSRYPIDAIYASSLRRAQETAGYIGQVHGLPVTPVADLREMDHGVWNGLNRAEIEAKYPGQTEKYNADPFHFIPEGGESGEMVLKRAAPALQAIVRAHPNQTVLIVAHKTTNRLLICKFIGIDPALYRDKLAQRPACINILAFPDETQAELLLLNDIGHYAYSPSPDYPYAV